MKASFAGFAPPSSIDAAARERSNKGMTRILAALLLLTLAAPAWGQDFEKGLRAYEQRDYATALRELRPLAERGHAAAQFKLGEMYEMYNLGVGVRLLLDRRKIILKKK